MSLCIVGNNWGITRIALSLIKVANGIDQVLRNERADLSFVPLFEWLFSSYFRSICFKCYSNNWVIVLTRGNLSCPVLQLQFTSSDVSKIRYSIMPHKVVFRVLKTLRKTDKIQYTQSVSKYVSINRNANWKCKNNGKSSYKHLSYLTML